MEIKSDNEMTICKPYVEKPKRKTSEKRNVSG